MAFSGVVKLIKELVTGTPADTDYFVFGNSDMKKITLPNLKKVLGVTKNQEDIKALNSALAVKTKAFTSPVGTGQGFAKKYGNVIVIYYEFRFTSNVTTWDTEVCKIPSDFFDTTKNYYSNSGKSFLYNNGKVISVCNYKIGEALYDNFCFIL